MGLTSTSSSSSSSSSSSPRISRESDTRETSWSASSLRHSPCSLLTNNTAATSCLVLSSPPRHPSSATYHNREKTSGLYSSLLTPPPLIFSTAFHILTLAPSPGSSPMLRADCAAPLLLLARRKGHATFPSFILPSPSSNCLLESSSFSDRPAIATDGRDTYSSHA